MYVLPDFCLPYCIQFVWFDVLCVQYQLSGGTTTTAERYQVWLQQRKSIQCCWSSLCLVADVPIIVSPGWLPWYNRYGCLGIKDQLSVYPPDVGLMYCWFINTFFLCQLPFQSIHHHYCLHSLAEVSLYYYYFSQSCVEWMFIRGRGIRWVWDLIMRMPLTFWSPTPSILLIFFILGGLCGTTKFFNLLTLNMFDPQIYFWQGVILTLTHFNRENTDVYRTDIKF